jgi:hypothetical protein
MYSISQFSYILYHINVTVILFSHTLAEVSNFLGFVSLFMAIARPWWWEVGRGRRGEGLSG